MATIDEALAAALDHHRAGRLAEAEDIYRQILAVDPSCPQAWHLLGVIANQAGQHGFAVEIVQRAVALAPDYAEAHCELGRSLRALGRIGEAAVSFRRAVELKPDYAEAHNDLGSAYFALGRLDDAAACHVVALAINPNDEHAHNNLGVALLIRGNLDQAVACFERALELHPNFAQAHDNLGTALKELGQPDGAVASHGRAIALAPDDADASNNLGNAYKDLAKWEEAISCYRRAVALRPSFSNAHGNIAYGLYFCPGCNRGMIHDEQRQWNEQHAAPLARLIRPHANDRSTARRLKVGYVSPDFCNHVQSLFTLPLLTAHDRENFEIVCYSSAVRRDHVTDRLRSLTAAWRDVAGIDDQAVAELIVEDRIDILVDLTMHMAYGRPLLFARKPAPVQVSWLAYPGTTGLTAIDYRLTDPFLDPVDAGPSSASQDTVKPPRRWSEEPVRLADTFWCYDPLTAEPAVNGLPAVEKGYVTFGSLNNFCKVNAGVQKLWARVLREVQRSRLLLWAPEGSCRQSVVDFLKDQGVAEERITFVGRRPRQQFLELHHEIDIGLDTLPYNGHTTSLDALWMGVPVVTIVGQTVVGRAGLSQLSNLGLTELVARSDDEFVWIAAELAGDLGRLSALRESLRGRMERSPLMDAPRFARSIEAAYRMMWRRWCEKGDPS